MPTSRRRCSSPTSRSWSTSGPSGAVRQVAPILDELANEHGDKITFVKMNVDENPVVPASYRVNGIPTINVYQGGEVVKSIVGARPKAVLLKELDEFISE
jgi:thioredoxin 1